ncbi:MAG: ferritin-like domain-containing protein [Janthinobacterium lividum]
MPKSQVSSLLCPTEKISEEQLITDRNLLAFERTLQRLNRRSFLSAFASAAVVGSFGAIATSSADAQSTATPSVADVLNFALNLEYLEVNFYMIAATGSGLPAAAMGTAPGALTGSPGKLPLDATTLALALALAQDEMNHVMLLRSTISSLGGTPIDQPAINLAAKGALTTQAQFLTSARQLTSLGGSAYAGAAAFLASNPSVLSTASQILGAEGQHQGAVNYQCVRQNIVGALDPQIDAIDVPPSASNYFTVLPTNSLGQQRTTSQVLGIAYGVSTATTTTATAGTTMGGYFPAGLNGNIKST